MGSGRQVLPSGGHKNTVVQSRSHSEGDIYTGFLLGVRLVVWSSLQARWRRRRRRRRRRRQRSWWRKVWTTARHTATALLLASSAPPAMWRLLLRLLSTAASGVGGKKAKRTTEAFLGSLSRKVAQGFPFQLAAGTTTASTTSCTPTANTTKYPRTPRGALSPLTASQPHCQRPTASISSISDDDDYNAEEAEELGAEEEKEKDYVVTKSGRQTLSY